MSDDEVDFMCNEHGGKVRTMRSMMSRTAMMMRMMLIGAEMTRRVMLRTAKNPWKRQKCLCNGSPNLLHWPFVH